MDQRDQLGGCAPTGEPDSRNARARLSGRGNPYQPAGLCVGGHVPSGELPSILLLSGGLSSRCTGRLAVYEEYMSRTAEPASVTVSTPSVLLNPSHSQHRPTAVGSADRIRVMKFVGIFAIGGTERQEIGRASCRERG